ncbi:MAG: rubrerythrin family protein, partial [Clostridia bacterium]|nr:rubrerythrin family protein [Clostridia bacterium]
IQEHAGSVENIRIDAGYPFHAGTIADGLRFAAEDEREESDVIYPAFAKTAREEGFEKIAFKFEKTAMVEGNHRIIFEYLFEAFENGSLFNAERPMLWICSECGYMHTSKSAWSVCPLCGSPQGDVELHLPFKKENI